MKRVIIALLLVMVLSLVLAGPVLADAGGTPNDSSAGNAEMGKTVSEFAPVNEELRAGQGPGENMAGGRPWSGAHASIRVF